MNSLTPRAKGLIGVVVAIGVVVGGIVLVSVFPSASNVGYEPDQPIPFSHKLHAGDNKIDCKYCHVGPERSRHSTVPSVNVCMNCHSVVKVDSPHIQKIHEAYKSGKPIEWVRVHELPDFVYFPHKRHIAAGLQCEECHGDVKKMEKISQYSDLTMGWCLNCHNGDTTPKHILRQKYPDMDHPAGPVASRDCLVCHH